jgi:uncharacterized protein
VNSFREKMALSPVTARGLPFAVFVLLTFFQGNLGPSSHYWVYFLKTVIGAWLVWLMWPSVMEMRWKISWEAVVIGIVTFAVWVGLDPFYPKFFQGAHWDPAARFGENSAPAIFFIAIRIAGSSIVVPPIEEIFYRSFLYRYIGNTDFQSIPLNRFDWRAFAVVSIFFGFAHREWLAGILCGMAYQWLVISKNRLGDAMAAHAITNLLLGLWIVWKGAWHFW